MFILIPTIIIFLSLSYIQLNDDVSIMTQSILYIIIVITLSISIKLYIKIKKDMKQQEINDIILEINKIRQRMKNETNENTIVNLEKKIQILENEKLKFT